MNVIDKILSEWSFRCHDGIVDMNDPKKTIILNEILEEFGLLEETVEDDILNAVISLSDEEKQKVLSYISNKFADEVKDFSKLEKEIENKIGNPDITDIISALAIKMGEGDKLLEYLSSNNQLSFDLGQKTGDLLNILEGTKLNRNFLSKIILFTPSEGNKALGVGEIALELFFKNTEKAKVGDIIVDGSLIELKSQGARFSGKGLGRAGNIEKLYSDLAKKYPEIEPSANLATYISEILNNFKTSEDLNFINKEVNNIYPETADIKITLEDIGNINKKLIKKYIASYVALYKNNNYYMLVSKESPFEYTLYTPEELIDNSDNLSFLNNITKTSSYPNLNLSKNKSSSGEDEIEKPKISAPKKAQQAAKETDEEREAKIAQEPGTIKLKQKLDQADEELKNWKEKNPGKNPKPDNVALKNFQQAEKDYKDYILNRKNALLKSKLEEELTDSLIKSFTEK